MAHSPAAGFVHGRSPTLLTCTFSFIDVRLRPTRTLCKQEVVGSSPIVSTRAVPVASRRPSSVGIESRFARAPRRRLSALHGGSRRLSAVNRD
jgi:hypothetical protein